MEGRAQPNTLYFKQLNSIWLLIVDSIAVKQHFCFIRTWPACLPCQPTLNIAQSEASVKFMFFAKHWISNTI